MVVNGQTLNRVTLAKIYLGKKEPNLRLNWKGCRHSSVEQSVPTILPPGFESQANHLSLYIIYSQFCAIFVIVLWKEQNKQKEAGFGPFLKKEWNQS